MNFRRVRYYKSLFLIAGIWNIVASLSLWTLGLLAPATAFELYGMVVPPTLFFVHAMMGFIVVFGIGYIIVSRNINENRGIVIMGVISKLIFFVDCVVSVGLGQARAIVLVNGTIDLLFAILFIEFLNSVKKETRSH